MCRLALLVVVVSAGSVCAQPPGEVNREAMKKLDFLAGKWEGEATLFRGKEQTKFTQTEDVRYKLDGVLLQVEGVGRGKLPGKDEEGVLFHALGVISYDAPAKRYRIKAYRVDGQAVDADLVLTDAGFVWGFREPARGVEIRYTVMHTAKGEWYQVGEHSPDGRNWTKFIEMTLTRVKE